MRVTPICLLLALAQLPALAQDLPAFEKKVSEFSLPNGLHFIVAERHEAPVISFLTYVNAGSADDPAGSTGLAHMFEHMALKGTDTIGSRDWPAEKKALDSIEEIADQIDSERGKGPKAESDKLDMLRLRFKGAVEAAQAFVVPNEFARVIEQNGGTGVTAATSDDSITFSYSLPANRMELWFLLESQRLLHPVFREFYPERDTGFARERERANSGAQSRLLQQFLAASFDAHPYRNPVLGWSGDAENLRASEARAFFDKYYVAANITMAIVGDVDPAEARRLAERYFSPLPARPAPSPVRTIEPQQIGDKVAVLNATNQPLLAVGYQRPDRLSIDDEVFDVLQLILTNGHTGTLYRDLIQERKLAVNALVSATFPGGRYPNEFVFLIVPAQNHTIEENQKALDALLARFAGAPVDPETLTRAKTKARSIAILRLGDNAGLASLLANAYAAYGDWRKLFTSMDRVNNVSAADVQRVATKYLIGRPRTIAYIHTPASASSAPGGRP